MKVLMVAAGERPSDTLFKKYIKYCDKTIAIDKGAEIFIDNNVIPDYVVGDFDSINEKYKDKINSFNIVKFPKEKDYTDSEIALKRAFRLDAHEIIMLGMTGKRVDHMLGNLGLLDISLRRGVNAYIIDDLNKIFLKDKNFSLEGNKGDIVSFYAYSSVVKNLNIRNAKYELENYDLDPFEGLCNSNEFLLGDMQVSFDFGKLLVIYSRD